MENSIFDFIFKIAYLSEKIQKPPSIFYVNFNILMHYRTQ
jgi:hypothetical protein